MTNKYSKVPLVFSFFLDIYVDNLKGKLRKIIKYLLAEVQP